MRMFYLRYELVGTYKTWLVIAERETEARALVPYPCLIEDIESCPDHVQGLARVIGWMGEPPPRFSELQIVREIAHHGEKRRHYERADGT